MASNDMVAGIQNLTTLAWDVYHSYFVVAEDSPLGFKQLVDELIALQGVLRYLRDHVDSNPLFVQELDEDHRQSLQQHLNTCHDTLQQLKELLAGYKILGIGDGDQFWQKMKWARQREQIDELKSNIMVHTCNLSVCVGSTNNSSLVKVDTSIVDSSKGKHVPSPSKPLSSPEDLGSPSTQTENEVTWAKDAGSSGLKLINPRILSQHTSILSNQTRISISSESIATERSDRPTYTRPMTSPSVMTTTHSTSQNISEIGSSPVTRDRYSFKPRLSKRGTMKYLPKVEEELTLSEMGESVLRKSLSHNAIRDVFSVTVHDDQRQILNQLHQPLRCEPRDRFYQPKAKLVSVFDSLAHNNLLIRCHNTSDWLRIAVWWLLKARATLNNCDRPSLVSPRGSLSSSIDYQPTNQQAYVDLLKASYILYDIVLKDPSTLALLTDENRKLISGLSEGIKEDFSGFSSLDVPEYSTIHSQSLDIWEPLQPEETSGTDSRASFISQTRRWLTVEQEDAGDEEEMVHFRAFVNAGIGSKRLRMRTRATPYMLLLSTREGESEPKMTICNQSGTLFLQRDFEPDDLTQLLQISHASLSGIPGAKISDPIFLKFGSRSISISFQHASDLMQFINIPKAYFDAVWKREPVHSDEFSETLIFRGSLEVLEQLNAQTMKSMNPVKVHKSCEIRILERSFGEAWRSIRRMVINGSASEKLPRCMELFVPMSRVQICLEEGSCRVLVKWSDTRQERSTKTDGNYHPLFSYMYDSNCPNIGLGMHFRSPNEAKCFERAILSLNLNFVFSWAQMSSAGYVYDAVDSGLDCKHYKAVLLLQNRLSWKSCNLYYLYRDTDYDYNHLTLRVRFPRMFFTDYISSHVDKLYPADQPVFFSHCEKKSSNFVVEFNDESILRAFMTSLASSYELSFSRRAVSLTTKGRSLFGSIKSRKGDTEVQLWKRENTFQLAARWGDHIIDKWLTMTIPSDLKRSRDGTRVEFPTVTYSRGTLFNIASMMAGAPKDPNKARRSGPITIGFSTEEDREDFVSVLRECSVVSRRYISSETLGSDFV